jgi:transmembrane sensor
MNQSPKDAPVPDAYDEAVRWLMALRQTSSRTPADIRQAFEQWLSADPEHRRAFETCRRDWEILEPLQDVYGPCRETSHLYSISGAGRTKLRWAWSVGIAATLATLVTLGVIAMERFGTAMETVAATQVAEQKTLTLEDGTRIDVNGRSRLRVRYQRAQRMIQLDEGEALFDVATDAGRPFVVQAGIGAIRVVGTAFQVTRDESRISVAVLRGQVRVERTTAPTLQVLLSAGHAVNLTAEGIGPIQAVAADTVGTWKKQVLVFDRAPLGEVIRALQRQYRGTLRIDPAAASLPLTAVIQFADIETTLAALPKTLPVAVEHPVADHWHVHLAAKQER